MRSISYVYAAFLGRPLFVRLNKFLYSLALRGMGIYNYQDSFVSGELWFIRNILRFAGKNLVVFDVGANIGCFADEIISNRVSVGQIYAFEPHSITYQKLLKNAIQKPIKAFNLGLSDQAGIATLYDRANENGTCHASLSNSIFSEVHQVKTDSTQIELTTVDEFCRLNKIELINFLKIDVEGYEINVLRGAEGMLKAQKIRLIQFEFTQLNSTLGVFFKDIYDLLSVNFDIYRLLPHGIDPIKAYDPIYHEIFGYQNFVCILKK